jgi:hypothetical protein
MSQRGRALFDSYVRGQLKHPVLGGISIQSHVHNLLYEARRAGISAAELEEEVGPLMQALSLARTRDEMEGFLPPDRKDKDGPPT